tara:strand:- start:4981 stop:5508 length:528 start_codon:yes stop_codon:yes gene_type:complete
MAIVIKLKSGSGIKLEKILLKAKKTIDGNIIVSDHPELDIMILTGQKKIVTLPKEELDDEVYDSQNRMFKFLMRRGVIKYDSVQGGNLFMSMEAAIPDADDGDKIQYLLYSIADFIEKEMPFYRNQEQFEKEMEEQLLEPEVDEYTEFDPRMHSQRKGSLPPRFTQWGINSIYRL